MKKLLIVIPILIAIGATAVVASVWQYGSYQDRAEMAAMCGIFGYRGTAQQNLSKEVQDCFKTFSGEYLGFSVITRYRTTLSSSMTSSQTTIPVSSMKTFDGDTITMAMLGSKVYLTVEPGSNREEIIKCTGISGSSWTGCTRGLAFSGTDESSVAANRKAHNAGSTVVISNVHYVYEELIDKDSNNTSTAKIISKDMLATSTMCLYDTNYCFRVNDGMIQWTVDNFTNSYNFTSSTISQLTASSTRAIGVTDSKVHLNISDDAGLVFDGSTGYLETLLNNSITSGTDGLAVNTSTDFTWTGNNTLSGNTLITGNTTTTGDFNLGGDVKKNGNIVNFFGGDGSDGALNVTSGTTTLDANSARVLIKNYTSINIAAGATLTISNQHANGTILVLKSQGDTTINGTIDLSEMGGSGGAARVNSGEGSSGSTGTGFLRNNDVLDILVSNTRISFNMSCVGLGGKSGSPSYSDDAGGGGGGAGYANGSNGNSGNSLGEGNLNGHGGLGGTKQYGIDGGLESYINSNLLYVAAGCGGGSGGVRYHGTSGAGGRGGGGLLFEVGGDLTYGASSVIDLSGGNGGSASGADEGASGGGGGGGGIGMAVYNGTLTDSGLTTIVTGGAGGSASGGSGKGGNGGVGKFTNNQNTEF